MKSGAILADRPTKEPNIITGGPSPKLPSYSCVLVSKKSWRNDKKEGYCGLTTETTENTSFLKCKLCDSSRVQEIEELWTSCFSQIILWKAENFSYGGLSLLIHQLSAACFQIKSCPICLWWENGSGSINYLSISHLEHYCQQRALGRHPSGDIAFQPEPPILAPNPGFSAGQFPDGHSLLWTDAWCRTEGQQCPAANS